MTAEINVFSVEKFKEFILKFKKFEII